MYITPEFMQRLLILIPLGGLVGAVFWDLLKLLIAAAISAISAVWQRKRRIQAARIRAFIGADQKEVQQ